MIQMEPVGIFHAGAKYPYEARRQADETSLGQIVLRPGLEQAIEDLEGFERIWIIYQFHQNKEWKPKVMPPRGPRVKRGVFATRAPYRPNPIGMSCVKLVKVEGLKITVEGHDLLDGTPVLDIKPYLPYADAFSEAKIGWLEDVESEKFEVNLNERSGKQMAWLEQNGVSQIRGFIIAQLEFDPLDHKRKRVEKSAVGYRLSYRTWRADFSVDQMSRKILVLSLSSGYSPEDLENSEDKYGDKDLHREFTQVT